MDKQKQDVTEASQGNGVDVAGARSLAISRDGVKTGREFANLMSALMSDLIEGRITPGVGNAVCNAGGKLLKIVELQAKYGQSNNGSDGRVLQLTD